MPPVRTLALAALVTVAPLPGVALGADAFAVPVSSTPVAVPVTPGGDFDWTGFYAGIYGAGQLSPEWDTQYGLGVNAGVNAQLEFFLVGAEVALHGLTGDTLGTTYGQVMGKAGVVITDDLLLYAAAGYGIDLGFPGEDDLLVGGGVEFAVTEDVSLRAQYMHGFTLSGDNPKDQVTLGANFHF